MDFFIKETEINGIMAFEIYGDLDVVNSEKTKERVMEYFQKGTRKVILDLRYVEHINSFGLGVLRGILHTITKLKGDMVLLKPVRGVLKTIQMIGLDEVFVICYEEEDALRALKSK